MIGTRLSERYEILSELGRGGMGVVYRAQDPLLGREVAIKLIPPTLLNPDSEARFQAEAQAVAKMDHPGIVPIYDIGRHEGSLYFVMPVVEGRSVRQVVRDEQLNLGEVLDLGIQVAEALEYSHAKGILHRDIKPENLMVTRDDANALRVRVMDFGLARDSNVTRYTKSGVLVGTMAYISPEQVTGRGVDARSDLYALGTVLYECLCGELPFSGEMQSILYRIVHEMPMRLSEQGMEIDGRLDDLVLSCLAKDPAQRPQTAGDLSKQLKSLHARLRDSDRMRTVMVTRAMAVQRPALSPFVGREEEVRELQQKLNAAKRGECQFVVIAGEPGSGKTRLLDELEGVVRAQHLRVLHGRLMERDGSFPYHGFCELIQDYFRQKEAGSSSAALPDFSDLGADLISLFPMLSEIEEIRAATTDSSQSLATDGARTPENRNQVYELLAKTLVRLAGNQPMVLFLEDLHGAEASIEALQYIVRRLGPTPTLIVATYRATEVEKGHPLVTMLGSFEGDRRFGALELGPLSASEHTMLLSTLVGGQPVDKRLAEQLYESSEGNPFFAKELVRSLMDSDSMIRNETGAWSLSGDGRISSDTLPATIQQAVERRIGDLPDDLRDILSTAAVIGKSFEFDDLEELLKDSKDLEDSVDRLLQEGLIEEDRRSRGDVLAFSSGVVREVLYGELSRRKRRSLHRKFAELLEERHRGRLERVYPQLVYHYSEGDVPEKSVEYGLAHARKSLETFSPDEAVRAVKSALEFLDEEWEGDPAMEGEARVLLAQAHEMAGDVTTALKEMEGAIRTAERRGGAAASVQPVLLAARMAWRARQTDETRRWVERGMPLARAEGANVELAEFLSLAATLANLQADYVRANEYLKEEDRIRKASAPEAVAEVIPPGGRLVVALTNPISLNDPSETTFVEEVEVLSNVFETLLQTDDEGRLIPCLCTDWKAEDDATRFVFTLREGVAFHDGTPLDAAAVKACFEDSIRRRGDEIRAGFSAIAGVFAFTAGEAAEVSGIQVVDPRHLEIRLSEALPIYPALLTEMDVAIALTPAGQTAPRTLGTGPYKLASTEGSSIVLTRHDGHWRTVPRLDSLEFRTGLPGGRIASGLRDGEIDLGKDLPTADLEELLRDPRFRGRLAEIPGRQAFFILFNSHSGPSTRNVELRRALVSVIRVQDLVWNTKGRFAEPAVGLFPPGMLGYDPGRRRHPVSVEEARTALVAAGVELPITLSAAISPANQDKHRELIAGIFGPWEELGVKVRIVTPTAESYTEMAAEPEGLDLIVGGWIADYDDPDAFAYQLFNTRTGYYRKAFSSAACDELLESARSETRPTARRAMYARFEDLMEGEAALVPLFHETVYRIPGPRVRGLRMQTSAPYINYSEVGKVEQDAVEVAAAAKGSAHVPFLSSLTLVLDPGALSYVTDGEVTSCLFEPLTRAVDGARIVPWLCAEFAVLEDGLTWRFKLRDGVRFHDGRRLTARDVRFSFERLLRSDYESRWILAPLKGAAEVLAGKTQELSGFRIQSATEFTVELEESLSFFPAMLSDMTLAIVPEGSDLKSGTWTDGCVGTGPFRVVRFEPGQEVVMERNPGYWREGLPRLQNLTFTRVKNQDEMFTGLRDGKYHLAEGLSPKQLDELRRAPEFVGGYEEIPSLNILYLTPNSQKGVFSEPAMRKRLAESVDWEGIVRNSSDFGQTPASGLIPPGLLGHDDSIRTGPAPQGGSMVTEATETSRIDIRLAIPPWWMDWRPSLIGQLRTALDRAGFNITLVGATREEFLRVQSEGNVDLFLIGWSADFPDTHAIVYGILDSRRGQLKSFLAPRYTESLDRLLQQARAERNAASRHAMYREVEEIVAREHLVIPIAFDKLCQLARPELQGVRLSFVQPFVAYEQLRIER